MKKDITELFVFIDDFCKVADEYLSAHMIGENRKPTRKTELTKAEILTIILMFQQSPCKISNTFIKVIYKPIMAKNSGYYAVIIDLLS